MPRSPRPEGVVQRVARQLRAPPRPPAAPTPPRRLQPDGERAPPTPPRRARPPAPRRRGRPRRRPARRRRPSKRGRPRRAPARLARAPHRRREVGLRRGEARHASSSQCSARGRVRLQRRRRSAAHADRARPMRLAKRASSSATPCERRATRSARRRLAPEADFQHRALPRVRSERACRAFRAQRLARRRVLGGDRAQACATDGARGRVRRARARSRKAAIWDVGSSPSQTASWSMTCRLRATRRARRGASAASRDATALPPLVRDASAFSRRAPAVLTATSSGSPWEQTRVFRPRSTFQRSRVAQNDRPGVADATSRNGVAQQRRRTAAGPRASRSCTIAHRARGLCVTSRRRRATARGADASRSIGGGARAACRALAPARRRAAAAGGRRRAPRRARQALAGDRDDGRASGEWCRTSGGGAGLDEAGARSQVERSEVVARRARSTASGRGRERLVGGRSGSP